MRRTRAECVALHMAGRVSCTAVAGRVSTDRQSLHQKAMRPCRGSKCPHKQGRHKVAWKGRQRAYQQPLLFSLAPLPCALLKLLQLPVARQALDCSAPCGKILCHSLPLQAATVTSSGDGPMPDRQSCAEVLTSSRPQRAKCVTTNGTSVPGSSTVCERSSATAPNAVRTCHPSTSSF